MNLMQKIVEVRKVAGGFSKDKKSYDYSYVTGNQILHKVRDKMNELNLLLIPQSHQGEWVTYDYKTSTGKEKTDFVVSGAMTYLWIDGDNPEDTLAVPWAYYGQQDDLSKAYGSALTYSERYFWLKCLGLPTDDDDPDSRQGDPDKMSAPRKPAPSKPSPSKPAPSKPADNKATEATLKQIKTNADEAGIKKDDLVAMAKEMFGVEKSTDLTQEQAAKLDAAIIKKMEDK